MGLIIGPTNWWVNELIALCPVATTLPDGSRIFCKAGGTAWIVAPSSTQVSSAWAGGQYNSTLVCDKCCIFEWPGLCAQLIACGFNPCNWFVPNISQLQSGYNCRAFWDNAGQDIWSSTECSCSTAPDLWFSNGATAVRSKSTTFCVRAFRCVTY